MDAETTITSGNGLAQPVMSSENDSRSRPDVSAASDMGEGGDPDASTPLTGADCKVSIDIGKDHHHQVDEVAIRLDRAFKGYGRGKKKSPVLIGLDMKVKRGQIYGLLGPSGCGKTTLLKCIVGKLRLDKGSVTVFGETPGKNSTCGVPGPRVGYMPQELALFGEFNIEETLSYFRRIFGMSREKYEKRVDFLMKFLDLPSKTRALENMSGGQQRRASLAVALLHEPELLILDEPTVGVDPLLRTSIWDHLTQDMTSTTIVITTHYIEEARQAHRVGMMRFGKLLAEDSPDNLLQRYLKPNLEDVFLELCLRDGNLETTGVREDRNSRPPIIKSFNDADTDMDLPAKKALKATAATPNGNALAVEYSNGKAHATSASATLQGTTRATSASATLQKTPHATSQTNNLTSCSTPSSQKVVACMIKTFTRMKKRVGFLIYQFVLPALQVSLFCLAIGQDPRDLPLAIVNLENGGQPCAGYPTECPVSRNFIGIESNEHLENFTCRYLSFLDSGIARPVYYEDEAKALEAVQNGHAWGMVVMDNNFTENLYERIFESLTNDDMSTIDQQLLDKSTIKVRMDVTNQHIAFTLKLKLVESFEKFMKQLISSCDMPEELASIPLVFDEPVHGTEELTFTDFMAPGIILTIVHSMALGYSAILIIMERNEGLMDRTWVAGVSPSQFALAHFLVSLVINLIQVLVTLVFTILIFQVPNEGSIFWVFLLTMLQGIAGTTIGLIISAVCQTQQDATQVALGIFYPNMILSGIIWPIESMPRLLRYISYALPQTFACEAMRGILLRGWGITFMPVWRGFAVTLAWIVVTYIIFRRLVNKQQ